MKYLCNLLNCSDFALIYTLVFGQSSFNLNTDMLILNAAMGFNFSTEIFEEIPL